MQQGEVQRVSALFQQMDGDRDGFVQARWRWLSCSGGKLCSGVWIMHLDSVVSHCSACQAVCW